MGTLMIAGRTWTVLVVLTLAAFVVGGAIGIVVSDVSGERGEAGLPTIRGDGPNRCVDASKHTAPLASVPSGSGASGALVESEGHSGIGSKLSSSGANVVHPDPLLQRVATALQEARSNVVGSGDGEISGVVLDEDTAEPISGVLVEAWRTEDVTSSAIKAFSNMSDQPTTLEDELDHAAGNFILAMQEASRRHGRYHHTRTDAQGKFVLRSLPISSYHITPREVRHRFRAVSEHGDAGDKWAHAEPGQSVKFLARRHWSLTVSVLMPDGTHASSITVKVERTLPDTAETMSGWWMPDTLRRDSVSVYCDGKPGEVLLEQGTYLLTASPYQKHGFVVSEARLVEVRKADAQHETIQLVKVPGISLTLSEEESTGNHESIEAYCIEAAPEHVPDYRDLQDKDMQARIADRGFWTTGTKQALHFKALRPGPHMLVLARKGRVIAHSNHIVGQDALEVSMSVPPRTRSEYVLIWVRDPDGNTLQKEVSATLECRIRGSILRQSPAFWRPLKSGARVADHVNLDGQEFSEGDKVWSAVVTHPEYGRKTVNYVPGAETEVHVQFESPCSVHFHVEGLRNHAAISHLNCEMRLTSGEHIRGVLFRPQGANTTDPHFIIRGIQPQEASCGLMLSTGSGKEIVLSRVQLRLASGLNNVRLTIPTLYSVTLSVPGAGRDSVFGCSPKFKVQDLSGVEREPYEFAFQTRLSRELEVRFPFLPGGTYTAWAYDRTSEKRFSAEFSLPGPEKVTLNEAR